MLASPSPVDRRPHPQEHDYDLRREREREALYRALAEIAAGAGYRAATPARVAETAGLPVAAFGEHFASTRECFLILYADTLDRLEDAIDGSVGSCGTGAWESEIEAAFRGALAFLARDPVLTRTCLLEASAVGPVAEARREEALRRLIARLDTLRSAHGELIPPLASELIVRGAHALVQARVERGETDRLPELLPELAGMWRGKHGG
jgi:AcrR family transcriptional regulator